ncbi:MAG: succinyl-diaminopimelate desuccinylase [Alphaproteobacteria bacterium GM7ARS4]|nr:succinyl-diaminopimelate desuccinylase [Alphaproteobacteria bacterium GM7ARS4]
MTSAEEIARHLVRFRSVTPKDDGLMAWVASFLSDNGFAVYRHGFGEGDGRVENLYGRLQGHKEGRGGKSVFGARDFAFAGHSDVVPATETGWSHPPFAGIVESGVLYGRGAVDMKGAVACFLSVCAAFAATRGRDFSGSLGIFLTNDEEGEAKHGMKPLWAWAKAHGYLPELCLLGEPSSQQKVGDSYRDRRRGSVHGFVEAWGQSGHSAYPRAGDNPLASLVTLFHALGETSFWHEDGLRGGDGEDVEDPDVALTQLESCSSVANVTPDHARGRFNIRFALPWQSRAILERVEALCEGVLGCGRYRLRTHVSSEAFRSCDRRWLPWFCDVCEGVVSMRPRQGRGGGTSDARFMYHECSVIELGLVGKSMHRVDEHCSLEDLSVLTSLYRSLLESFFS